MFRQRNLAVRMAPRDGLQVLLRARVGLYEARGEFQLVVDHLEEAGEGELRRRFEALKLKLAAEGLFDAARKRALPRFPRRVGVVTSATGAALRDVLHVLAAPLPRRPGPPLPRARPGRGRRPRDRGDARARGPAGRGRRAAPGARRRIARGPLGLQRRGARARDRRARPAGHHRHRPRGRFHDRRFRRRREGADAVRGGRARRPGRGRVARSGRRDGDTAVVGRGARARPARRRDAGRRPSPGPAAPGPGRARAHAAARRAASPARSRAMRRESRSRGERLLRIAAELDAASPASRLAALRQRTTHAARPAGAVARVTASRSRAAACRPRCRRCMRRARWRRSGAATRS